MVWPIVWIVYTFIRGALVDWYPYPFLDVGEVGLEVALRNTLFVLVVAGVLLAAFELLDRHLPPRP